MKLPRFEKKPPHASPAGPQSDFRLPAPGPRLRAFGRGCLRALRPPVWAVLLLVAASAAGLAWVFLNGHDESLLSLPVYLLSAYAFTALCLRVAGWVKAIDRATEQNKFTHALRHSDRLRTLFQLAGGLAGTAADAATKLYGSVRYASGWLAAAGWYNLVLTALQLLLLADLLHREMDYRRALRHYRLCGQLLCACTVPLAVLLAQLVLEGGDAAYSDVYVIWTALTTFYGLIKALIHLVQARRLAQPVLAAADCLDYAQALVQVLSLQVLMFAVFGQEMPARSQTLMNLFTGAGVFLLVVSICVYMLRRSKRELRKLDAGPDGGGEGFVAF